MGKVGSIIDGVGRDAQARSSGVLKRGGVSAALSQPPEPDEAERHEVRAVMLMTNTAASS